MKKRILSLVLAFILGFGLFMPAMAVYASELPYEEPEPPYEVPELPYEEPEGPELPYEEPELPYEEPELPYEEPELPYEESELPYEEPELPYEEPELPYDDLELPYDEDELPYVAPIIFAVGDIILFGNYVWRVLDVQGDRMLVISEHVIMNRPFHYIAERMTWEHSDARRFLNNEFLLTFSLDELARIAVTYVVNDDNQEFGTSGGNNTMDRIFLLSLEELERYFIDNGTRLALNLDGRARGWWLRSPGRSPFRVALVIRDGSLRDRGYYAHWGAFGFGMRPAMWLYLDLPSITEAYDEVEQD